MRWSELKDFSKKYGDSCTFSRTFFHQGIWSGLLEYRHKAHYDRVFKELAGKRIEGSDRACEIVDGDLGEEEYLRRKEVGKQQFSIVFTFVGFFFQKNESAQCD